MEGVTVGLRRLLRDPARDGLWVVQIRASGGWARSPLWRQILADILDTEVVTMNVTEGAAYGAALIAGVGAGVFPSVEGACEATLKATTRMEPVRAYRDVCVSLYGEYRSLYAALRPAFEQLAGVALDGAPDRHQTA